MTEIKASRPRLVLGLGIALAAFGLGLFAYVPQDKPLVVAASALPVMIGYLMGRWAVHRMAREDDR